MLVASIGMYNGRSQLMRSTNYGITWDKVVTVVNGNTQMNLQGYEFVGFDSQVPKNVYAGNRISTDAGLTFHPIDFPAESYINGEAPNVYGISTDFSGNTYVFALDLNRVKIYRSDDHGATWFLFASLSDFGTSARYTTSQPTFTPHPTNPNIIYTLNKQADLLKVVYDPVYKLVTFTSLNMFNYLPPWMPADVKTYIQIRHIAIDPVNPKVIYVSTIAAGIPWVYRSLDGGASWESISDDISHMPGTPVINPHTRELFKGSMNGTAIYPAPPDDPTPPDAPTANAGSDQSVDEGAAVTLDGAGSTNTINEPLVYSWTAPAGITLNSTATPRPTFTAPDVSVATDYIFSLTVNNGIKSSTSDEVMVTVNPVIVETETDHSMNIYPNPTHGQVTIVFDRLYGNGAYLTVNDITGRIIYKRLIISEEETLDLTGLPHGIYLISTSVKELKTQKVILN